MDYYAQIRCERCQGIIDIPWELIGDTRPENVTGYLCDECEIEDEDDDDGYEVDWDDDPTDYTMYPLEWGDEND